MKDLRSQKGSITIFVVASCLLFATTVVGIATYVQNKVNNEDEKYRRIKANYEQDVGRENEIYNDIISKGNIDTTDTNVSFDSKEVYVIPTGSTTVSISQKFDILKTDEISNIEYAWATSQNQTISDSAWTSLPNGDNTYTVKVNKGAGSYYLKVRLNGSDIVTSEAIKVVSSTITLDTTNKKIVFGNYLKYNHKIGVGSSEEQAKENKIAVSVDTNNKAAVTITSGQYIYAEATDSYGNKVYFSKQN